jgi:hypothetical protein
MRDVGCLDDMLARPRLHPGTFGRYDSTMDAPRTRRIWHFEADPLCEVLDHAGAWQAAVRIRIAHQQALLRRPDGTAFDFRPTPEDVAELNLALDAMRAEQARESRLS